ncbi:hypothetical protein MNBD_GAMMA09-178 [hydrothermal vent metagenome]|uniref:SbsA Ig-like domain-containing protein n=1 Tax=hydrothermal vent metagenome TaxID=652676 RepID=A0A3B0X2D4_9ZZZZ
MLKQMHHLIFITVLSTLLVACGGGGGGDDGSTADTSAPTVSSTSPENSATAVLRNSILSASFDEDLFAVTVDATSFTFEETGSNGISGTVSFDSASNVASFAPDNELAMLTAYTATLSTAITDLSGNALATDYRWSFTTADGAWNNAELIEDDAGGAYFPQIAVDSSGKALAVWQQYDGSDYSIWANRFDGTNWDSAERIETGTGHAYSPQIAVDSSGKALAVWRQSDGIRSSIWANRFDGTNWGSAELIETGTRDAYDPQIAVDSSGKALVVWRQYDGIRYNIWASRFDGTSWGSAELIEDDAGPAYNPQIAVDSSGRALAVWQQLDYLGFIHIWANNFDGTNWDSAISIERKSAKATNPQIAIDSNGKALAVWQQVDVDGGVREGIWTNDFDGARWGRPKLIETNTGNANNPKIIFNSSGKAFVVWAQIDGDDRSGIWVNRFDGANWGSAERIETGTGYAVSPQIAVDSSGKALAVWEQRDGSRHNIWANRFDGTNWGSAKRIETGTGYAVSPQIAVDSSGKALAVWEQRDGSRYNILVNRFE